MIEIETKTQRLRLEVRWKPYFVTLGKGIALGYRRTDAAGTWSVRLSDGKGGNSVKRIAAADDMQRADGKAIMSFAQARDAALKLGRGDTEAPAPVVITLHEAIGDYEEDLKARKAGVDNVSRLKHNVPSSMLKRPVALLDVTELRKWRDALTKRMAAPTVNRTITIMKAVLNLAADKDEFLSKRPWEIGLAAIPEATTADNVVLPETTIHQLVDASYEVGYEFGLLVETLAHTGARVSQLARVQVRDLLDDDRLMVPSSAKGQKKRMTKIPVPIPTTLADSLRVFAAGRPLSAPLLVKASGQRWAKSDHSRPFERAVTAIGEDPDVVTSYALRHSHITAQLLGGLPASVVSKLHDTSAAQVEKHYAATIASFADDKVRATMMTRKPRGEVVRLRG